MHLPQQARQRLVVGVVLAAINMAACTHDESPAPAPERAAAPSPLVRRSPRILERQPVAPTSAPTPEAIAEPTGDAAATVPPTSAIELEIDADPDIGRAPLTVQFSAVIAREPAAPWSYQWDFGDGSQDTSNPTSHTYGEPGEYTATLTVTDDTGQSRTHDVVIQVDPPEGDARAP